jgi:3D (Asp-Asp-Asp) domain-containing protein
VPGSDRPAETESRQAAIHLAFPSDPINRGRLAPLPHTTTCRPPSTFCVVLVDRDRKPREERKIGLIGRFLCAVAAATIVSLASAVALTAAASPSVTDVRWHRDGTLTWDRVEQRVIRPPTVHRLAVNIAPGRSQLVAAGKPGLVIVRVRYAQRGGGPVRASVLSVSVLRAAKPRIVADGVGGSPLSKFEARGVAGMTFIARTAMEMIATAYTADSAGGDGMTAIGRRAGRGIVAVDPSVIPIGTRLYIPGYGFAVAGDTGGAIVGHRIDLGFDSVRDALLFGRRDVTVYRLK